jgi:hypothetical protein
MKKVFGQAGGGIVVNTGLTILVGSRVRVQLQPLSPLGEKMAIVFFILEFSSKVAKTSECIHKT